MKLNVELAIYNDNGIIASVRDSNGWGAEVALTRTRRNPIAVCQAAARALRAAAAQFERLAREQEPLKCDTQDRINRTRGK